MKDWKGNDIEEGDTIVLVSTKSHPIDSSLVLMNLGSNEPPTVLSTYKEDARYRWLVLNTYKIKNIRGRLYVTFNDDGITCNYGITTLDFFKGDHAIICIKGKSDNETEYYQHYFNHE
jgi:hypothetical protein